MTELLPTTAVLARQGKPGGGREAIHVNDGIGPALRRIGAMVLRYWFLLRGSWPRLFELMYWPMVQVMLWGFISEFFTSQSDYLQQAVGVLLHGVLLWDVLFRGQIGVSVCFLEEMWSRNLGHLFVSPLRPTEWVLALMTMSLIRTLIGLIPAALIAIPLYGVNFFSLGLPLIAFFASLIVMGWWLALLIVSVILRHGLGAESLAWMAVFLLAPLSCVYYPASTLPDWLQMVAFALPSPYIFEGMRTLLHDGILRTDFLLTAAGLNLGFLVVALTVFLRSVHHARETGSLLQMGE